MKSTKNLVDTKITAESTKWNYGIKKGNDKLVDPILPKEGETNILITSALPYVNNVPHLGNIIGCVLSADCYARYCRLRGYRTLFICGTDEYGTATENKAIEEKLSCQEICDKYHKIHKEVYDWFSISFNYFGRTTTVHQTQIAQDIFLKLHNKGLLLEDTVEQLFCQNCEKFLADRFVEGTCPKCLYPEARGDQCDKCGKILNPIELLEPKCKICKSNPIIKSSKHLFLDLPKLEPTLNEFIAKSQSKGMWSANSSAITKSWIQEGLKPRCITRDLKWGTPVPLEEYSSKVFYVWFDAPIGYISITAGYTKDWEKWWKNPDQVKLVNFMAKDNVPFHTVIFPASLLGTGDNYTLLSDISSTEYLNYENTKFSKSRGVGVFGTNAMDSGIPSDIFRLYLLANRPESHDTSFNWDDLISHNNNEFINNLGNFINRCITLLSKKFDGKIQPVLIADEELQVIKEINQGLISYNDCMEKYRFREAFSYLLSISTIGNKYIQNNKPWELNDEDINQKNKLGSILSFSANIVAVLSILLEPFAPNISQQIKNDVGISDLNYTLTNEFVRYLSEDSLINKPVIYFHKIDPSKAAELRLKYGGAQEDKEKSKLCENISQMSFDEFSGKSKEELNKMIEDQVEHIKKIKAEKAEKSLVKAQVNKLQALRKTVEKIEN